MPVNSPAPIAPADSARLRAAALFTAAARSDTDVRADARLRCLAASQTLIDALPVEASERFADTHRHAPSDPGVLVRAALRVLGGLTLEQFAARDIRAAAAHGRRALRALT